MSTAEPRATEIGSISIVVLTYKRVADLTDLLPLLAEQIDKAGHPDVEVVVVDNDPEGSARAAVTDPPRPGVRYVHEPAPGIAHARNRALDETSHAHLLIFIDDDERPLDTWLSSMLQTYEATRSVGVIGPVLPDYEVDPDPWIVAGGFFVRKQFRSGTEMPAAGTGNLLLDLRQVRALGSPRFDERFGMTGGSDTLFTRTLVRAGGKLVWCEPAGVLDKVPVQRLTRRWVLSRAYRSGNTWSRTTLELVQPGPARIVARLRMIAKGVVRIGAGAVRVVYGTAARSPRHQARGCRTVARGMGMVGGAGGLAYQEYRRNAKVTP